MTSFRRRRIAAVVVFGGCVAISLVGCVGTASVPPPKSPAASSPTTTPIEPGALIGQVIDPVGSTWTGTDSAGDLSVFTLRKDHTVEVTFGTNTFDESGDTWVVRAGVLSLHIHIDPANGYLDYAGRYDAATGVIDATGTTSVSGKTVSVILSKR